ncbi:MAG: hypothetical protein ACRDHU_02340 [Actinomycetota bacterium]
MTDPATRQRRLAAVKHRAYARTEEARRLPDHRVKYQRRKVRRLYPFLGEADDVAIAARVYQAIVVKDVQEEANAYRRRGETIPRRLREDLQRAVRRLVDYDAELRRRNDENAARSDPSAFFVALGGGS